MPQDGAVISVPLARKLRDAGLDWTPARGDRFIIADRGMDDESFVLSDMTIEVQRFPSGPVIGFNGTTEWALDSLDQSDALWLPAEDQLRALLGPGFTGLTRTGDGGYRVTVGHGDTASAYEATDAADAYGLALLELLLSRPGEHP
jgi:hypothetical protein